MTMNFVLNENLQDCVLVFWDVFELNRFFFFFFFLETWKLEYKWRIFTSGSGSFFFTNWLIAGSTQIFHMWISVCDVIVYHVIICIQRVSPYSQQSQRGVTEGVILIAHTTYSFSLYKLNTLEGIELLRILFHETFPCANFCLLFF